MQWKPSLSRVRGRGYHRAGDSCPQPQTTRSETTYWKVSHSTSRWSNDLTINVLHVLVALILTTATSWLFGMGHNNNVNLYFVVRINVYTCMFNFWWELKEVIGMSTCIEMCLVIYVYFFDKSVLSILKVIIFQIGLYWISRTCRY